MSFCRNLVMSVCEGAWFKRTGYSQVLKSIFKFFTPLTEDIVSPMEFFSYNFASIFEKSISWSYLVENLISSISGNISRFCT